MAVVTASCVICMFVASCFMSLFDVAFDSLIFSWLHDGKQSSVIFAPQGLLQALGQPRADVELGGRCGWRLKEAI